MKTMRAPYRTGAGVRPGPRRRLTETRPIVTAPLPPLLTVSMSQHLGAPAQPIVRKGDTVLGGQMIGRPSGSVSAAVHAPTSGVVKRIENARTPTGAIAPAIVIEPNGQNRFDSFVKPRENWQELSPSQLVFLVGASGIVGMGGAGFPAHVKLSPPAGKRIDTFIVNGAECEPYLTADYRLMLEHADRICGGIEIVRKILDPNVVRVAIEGHRPEVIRTIHKALARLRGDVGVAVLEPKYPQGAEKQQIYAITGREVPSGGLPMDVGVLVHNVGTVAAIWDAVAMGRPLTERIVTVTGTGIGAPSNLRVRIGTPFSVLVDFCGGMDDDVAKVICGGPMMGLAQCSLDTAVAKTTSGILALSTTDTTLFSSMPCVRCGRCVDVCPMHLMPNELSACIEAEDYGAARQRHVLDCIECGCCAFTCPAHRPLVQLLRHGKAQAAALTRSLKEQERTP